jgi:hypothetical protein
MTAAAKSSLLNQGLEVSVGDIASELYSVNVGSPI